MSMIAAVKSQVDLAAFLRDSGIEFKKAGNGLRSDSCPHCGTKPHSNRLGVRGGRYHCFSCGGKGDVVDAAAALKGCSIGDAAKWLQQEYWVSETLPPRVAEPTPIRPETPPELARAISALYESALTESPALEKYLREERCLSERVIREAVDRGILRFLPNDPFAARDLMADAVGGRDVLVEAGLMRAGKRMPAGAYRPILWFFPEMDSIEFRLGRKAGESERKAIRYGTATQPSSWNRGADHTAFVEGLIDMLSMVDLGFEGNVKGIPGVNTWKPEWFLDENEPWACFDGDRGGRRAAENVKTTMLEEHGKTVYTRCPPTGDINDQLRAKRLQSTQESVA